MVHIQDTKRNVNSKMHTFQLHFPPTYYTCIYLTQKHCNDRVWTPKSPTANVVRRGLPHHPLGGRVLTPTDRGKSCRPLN